MPGIAGIVSASPAAADELRCMVSCMLHDPSYTSGMNSDSKLGCHVAATNHRGSFSDRMPLWSAARDVCLVFSGEAFTDASALDELRRRGHRVDAEEPDYLVSMYEELGASFVTRLNGWFSAVLIDLRRQSAMLFNDRYGVNRVYWRRTDRGFYFASEAKALLRTFPDLRRLDPTGVAEMFSLGCVLQNRTLFPGLSLLPPASIWTLDANGRVEQQSYFSPSDWEQQATLDGAAFYEKLKTSFARVLPRYFRGPGGAPCRLRAAWMGE